MNPQSVGAYTMATVCIVRGVTGCLVPLCTPHAGSWDRELQGRCELNVCAACHVKYGKGGWLAPYTLYNCGSLKPAHAGRRACSLIDYRLVYPLPDLSQNPKLYSEKVKLDPPLALNQDGAPGFGYVLTFLPNNVILAL